MSAKRKVEFVLADPFLKTNSVNSLQSIFERIVLEKPKQKERVHCLWEPCLQKISRRFFNSWWQKKASPRLVFFGVTARKCITTG